MKNIKKILPAIAAAGVIGVLGASNASAYNYTQQPGYQGGEYSATADPSNVEICYEVSGIITPFATTYTIPITVTSSSSINLGNVTATAAADTTYTSSSATSGNFTITFNEDGSQNTVTKCAHLNFSSALDRAAAFDTHIVKMGTPTSSNANAPVDREAGKQITFGYQLATDGTGAPKQASGVYQAEYWTKGTPSYESTIPLVKTHIEVTKTVKGNAAQPEAGFTFKARVAKKYSSITDTGYRIYISNGTTKSCTLASSMTDTAHDCEFTLNHGETAYIGCSGANCQTSNSLPLNAIEYSITESNAKGHTPYIDGATSSSKTTGTEQLDTENKSHAFVNEKTNTIAGRFFNIVPFIILAILATVGVVTLRKANKKHEA